MRIIHKIADISKSYRKEFYICIKLLYKKL